MAALKVIDRRNIQNEEAMQWLRSEIAILRTLKSEYVAQLYTCFQDKSNYYLLLELCDQGELFSALQRDKKYSRLLKGLKEFDFRT